MTAPAADGGKNESNHDFGVDHFFSVKLIIFRALQSSVARLWQGRVFDQVLTGQENTSVQPPGDKR
jgi:hypothetical protein